MDEGEAVELLSGEFMLLRIFDQDICLATIVKVGEDLQWPLTKDEPVVKLDSLSYLFTLPMKDGDPLSYGVSFPEHYGGSLGSLDSFLKEHSCFTGLTSNKSKGVDWKEFAPRVEDYNNFLAKAIAGGTGQIVKGIFKCSNAYTNQVCFLLLLLTLLPSVWSISRMIWKLFYNNLLIIKIQHCKILFSLTEFQPKNDNKTENFL